MTRVRHEYMLKLSDHVAPEREPGPRDMSLRIPAAADLPALAELMLDAFRDTIDYEGETLQEAQGEVRSFFDGQKGPAMLDCSWLLFVEGQLAAASLVGWWDKRGAPLVYYVMTAAKWKRQGLGARVLAESLRRLSAAGHREVRAVITEGNTPSERLCARAGFRVVQPFTA
jgi:RimJ/RimL family protein N-acetyltransferase